MKSDKLKLHIRQIVREEVAMAINEVITEMKRPTVVTNTRGQKNKRKPIVVDKKQFSSNPVLNDILNETANSETDLESFSSDIMHDDDNIIYENADVAQSNVPGFMTRDYSSVLEQSYEKTKLKAGSA